MTFRGHEGWRRHLPKIALWLVVLFLSSPPGWATEPSPGPDSALVELLITGDVLPPAGLEAWSEVGERLHRADLVFVNLEGPITTRETVTAHKNPRALAAGRDYVLRLGDPAVATDLREAGVGLAGLANNHMLDFREEGLLDTLAHLEQAGVPWVGAGEDEEAAMTPYLFEKQGIRIALLAFSDVVPARFWATASKPGIASSKEEDGLVRAIEAARAEADHVVVMMHWGEHLEEQPSKRQRYLGRLAVHAGAEVVVGMHPHRLQATEWVETDRPAGRQGVIFYSLGNFIFRMRNLPRQQAAVARLVFSQGQFEASLLPVELSRDGIPRWVAGESSGGEVLSRIRWLSLRFGTDIDADGRVQLSVLGQTLADDIE